MSSSGPASQGQFSGQGCREQVMTRQPAEEKRITVACPMPRLAPVRSSVRRGVLAEFGMNGSLFLRHARPCAGHPRLTFSRRRRKTWMAGTSPAMTPTLWIKPRLGPWLLRPRPAEFDAVVQAERAGVPELQMGMQNTPPPPARRARHFARDVLGRDPFNRRVA